MSYHWQACLDTATCTCPACRQPAEVIEGGAGRFWWRCEQCKWESDIAPANLIPALGELITMNCVAVHFYDDTEDSDE